MKALIFLVVLLNAGLLFGQSVSIEDLKSKAKSEKLKNVTIFYDKFRDLSAVGIKPQVIDSSSGGILPILATGSPRPSALVLGVTGYFPGSVLKKSVDEFEILFGWGGSKWSPSDQDTTLYLIVDGQRFELKPNRRENSNPTYPGTMRPEALIYLVPRSDLEKIASAQIVEFRLGTTIPGKFKIEHLSRIKELLTLTNI